MLGKAAAGVHATIVPTVSMERASRLLRKLKLPSGSVDSEQLVCAAWPSSVGRTIAARSHPARLCGRRLVVEVDDALWMRQLAGMSLQIRDSINRTLGEDLLDDLEFRVATPRREVRRASHSSAEFRLTDEAERIPDPVMRGIYRAARRKALA